MSVKLIVNFNVKSEKVQVFKDLLGGVKTDLPKVSGCHGVQILHHTDSPTAFTLVET